MSFGAPNRIAISVLGGHQSDPYVGRPHRVCELAGLGRASQHIAQPDAVGEQHAITNFFDLKREIPRRYDIP